MVANDRVRRALLLMEQHLSDRLTVDEIARRLCISTRQFERLFRQSTGMSPTRFYRNLRLRYGLWLLRNTERSITTIALETGFSDCAHFSRQFRDRYGVSPSDMRRNNPGVEPAAMAFASDFELPPDRRLFDDPAFEPAVAPS